MKQSHPVLPQGGGAGWNDTNYWSADDPANGVGNPPGAAVDGGAGSANFQFAAPVISLPGRGINIALGLSYNSRLWNRANSEIDYDNDRGWPAPGFSLGFGKMLGMGVYHGAMLVDADGTRHAYSGSISAIYNGSHGVMHTTDGSFIDYEYWTGTGGVMTQAFARLPNGTMIKYYAQGPGGLYPTNIEDANGNYITVTYVNNTAPRIDTVTDTLGRVITFSYDPNNLLTAITAPGYLGGTRTLVRLHYHQLSLNYAFSGLTHSVRDSYPWVVDAIYYPGTATGYWLNDSDSYSSYGMLAKVVEERNMSFSASSLNDMGSVSEGLVTRSETYNYPLYVGDSSGTQSSNLTDAPTYSTMTERWSVDGSTFDQATTQYEVHENDTPRMTIITLPNGTKSKQLAYNAPGQYYDGLMYHDETYVTEGTILQSSTSTWASGAYDSPRPTRIEKTDERGQMTAAEFGYGSVYNQVTEVRDYDYGGTALLRATRTTYPNSSSYTNRHIFNLASSVSVLGSDYSTVVSRTDYAYDGQTLADAPGVVMHDETANPYTTSTYDYCCEWDYDQDGFQYCAQYCSQSSYDPSTDYRGNVTSVTSYADANTGSGGIAETRTYDITGNVVTASTSCCEQTSFNYTVDTQYAYPLSKTRGSASDVYAQVTTSATYDVYTGLGRSATDANGRQSTTDYDPNALRPTTVTSSTLAHTDYAYDDTAMTVTSTTYLTTGTSGTIADENMKYLNGRGQVRMEKALGANNVWDFVDTIYDSMGQMTQQSRPYRSGDTKQFTSAIYDSLGRTTSVTAPDGSVNYTYYNESSRPDVASSTAGETTRVKDAWGRERWGRTDASGRLVEVVEPNPSGNGAVATSGLVTTYAYDTVGNLITVTQGAQTRSFAYDSLGRLTAQKLAETEATLNSSGSYVGSGTWSDVFTYDSRSNLTSRTDARGVKTVYIYNNDPLNRLQSVSWDTSGFGDTANPITGAATVSYSYRSKSSSTDVKDVTEVSSVSTDSVSTESYDYDTEGRVYNKTLTLSNRSSYPFVTTYSFDALDRITDVQYPAEYGNGSAPRKIVHHNYDIASRLSSLTYDGQNFASSIVYNAASQTTSLNVGSGTNQIAESYAYNAQTGFLDGQTVVRGTTTLLDLSYDYTNSSGKRTGQLTKITNNLDSSHAKDRGYSYDALGRLTQATGGPSSAPTWTESYVYDRYGNRTSVSATGTSARNRDSKTRDGSLVASNASHTLAFGSINTPSTPAVDLPTDLIARTIPSERENSPTAKDGSQPVDDASRSLYKPSGNRSSETSAPVSPPVFTDPNLLAAGVTIKAVHITELRDAINDLRVRFGFARYTWTKPTNTNGVVAPGGAITADPIIEMRTALDQVLGPPSPAYAAGLAQGQPVLAVHIQELRDRVVAGWNLSSQIPRDGYASLIYDTTSNRITTSGFAYDKAGNQVRALIPAGSGSQRYKYDAANRMVQVLADNGTTVLATYTYGDSNEKLISDEGGYRTYFDCEGGATIAEYTEADASSVPAWSKSYVYLGGRLLSTVTPNGSGGEATEFHHPDRLGTRLVTDPSNGTSFEQVTLPFGTALNAESTGSTNRRFTSYDRIATTGLDYAYNRHYDSQQGRFTQVDPAGMKATCIERPQTLNLYSYVTNDPVNQADPTGLGFFSFLKKVFKIIAIAVAVALIVIAVVTLGHVELLTTLHYFLSAASTLAYAFGKKKLGLILGTLSFGLGAFSGDFSFGFEEARSSKVGKILMAVGPIAAFLGDEPGPGMKRKRRRKRPEPHPPGTVTVILVSPPEERKPTWGECFTQCTGSARDSVVGRGCGSACSKCAGSPGSAWCRACAVCLGVAIGTVEFCTLKCCQLVGCPADK
ncbi:MAG TPA: RHS repeat-associated core domain-containing protein [Pyrinomonadaceae bacterium]|nr:RHS repeat-associated core domain-containing protein [Pyrinomonadaceae bacterium]